MAALNRLVKTKRLAKNAPIPCRLLADDEATSAGLAENLSRVAMHPADAFEAFAALIGQGKTVDDVAFRAGTIDEEDAKAFAITTDHAAQDRAFAGLATAGPTLTRTASAGKQRLRRVRTRAADQG